MTLYAIRAYFATLYAVITVHAVENFLRTIRFINQISMEFPYETYLASDILFTKLSTKTLGFDAAMFPISK